LQAIARRKAEPARARVDARKDAVLPHVPRIADAGGRVRHRAGGDAARVEHPQRGDAGVVLADAGIVEKDSAQRNGEREFAGADTAVRSSDDDRAGVGRIEREELSDRPLCG
jgi:hypothetical protein